MTIKKVLLFGNPLLRKKSTKVTDFNSRLNKKMMKDLKDTLLKLKKNHKKGGGLAAPQIGYLKRIIFINAEGNSFYMINPRIIQKSKKMIDVWDFCFSCNASFLAKIKRHKKIVVEFYNEKGGKEVSNFKDYFSELIQHEIDHLNGRLFIDLIKNPKLIMMMEEWDKKYKYTQN